MRYSLIRKHLEVNGRLIDSISLQGIYNRSWVQNRFNIMNLIKKGILKPVKNQYGIYIINKEKLEQYEGGY